MDSSFLAMSLKIKDLGELKYFLGIEVARSKKGIFKCQRKYTPDLLEEMGMVGAKLVDTPIEQNHGLCSDSVKLLDDPSLYQRRLVGKLIYLTITRLAIGFAVNLVSQFMHAPRIKYLQAVYRILKYPKKAPGQGIMYSKHGNIDIEIIEIFIDADWAGSKTDRRSSTRYCAFVGGNLVSWKSKNQLVFMLLNFEVEHRAMARGTCELLWLQMPMQVLGFKCNKPMFLHCDNNYACYIVANLVYHERTKHIEVDCHFV